MAGRYKGFFKQSGVIPVLDNRLVLITSRKSERWIIPKGYVEKGLSPSESAAKEAYEEAGLIGVVHHHGSIGVRQILTAADSRSSGQPRQG